MSNETILIIGAAGNNGTATIESLVNKNLAKTQIRAAVLPYKMFQHLYCHICYTDLVFFLF